MAAMVFSLMILSRTVVFDAAKLPMIQRHESIVSEDVSEFNKS